MCMVFITDVVLKWFWLSEMEFKMYHKKQFKLALFKRNRVIKNTVMVTRQVQQVPRISQKIACPGNTGPGPSTFV